MFPLGFPPPEMARLYKNDDFEIRAARDLGEDIVSGHFEGFVSGQGMLDLRLRDFVSMATSSPNFAMRLAVDPKGWTIGYYALTTTHIERSSLPLAVMPEWSLPSMPVCKIALFAVRSELQGQGLGRQIFVCALAEAEATARSRNQPAVVLDPVDSAVPTYFERFAFVRLPGSDTMLLPLPDLREILTQFY